MTTTRTARPHDELTTDPRRRSSTPRIGWTHVNRASRIPDRSRALAPARPVTPRCVARDQASRPDSPERQAYRSFTCSESAGGLQPRHTQRAAVAVRAWPGDLVHTGEPSHHPHHPHTGCSATAGALPRRLTVQRSCAFGAAQSSVVLGARLTAASCFHTLVSSIRRVRAGCGRPDENAHGSSSKPLLDDRPLPAARPMAAGRPNRRYGASRKTCRLLSEASTAWISPVVRPGHADTNHLDNPLAHTRAIGHRLCPWSQEMS